MRRAMDHREYLACPVGRYVATGDPRGRSRARADRAPRATKDADKRATARLENRPVSPALRSWLRPEFQDD